MATSAFSRRAVLRATIPTIAGAAALPALVASPNVPDALYDAIMAYRAGNAAFDALLLTDIQEEEDAQVHATYGPPMQRLTDWSAPATSLRGVAEAIRIILDEESFSCFTTEPLLRASLAYLDTLGEAA